MNQVIAAHGWAGDAMVWRAWQQRFEARGWHWDAVERGYGQREPHQPSWAELPGQRLVIAHSLGLHLLPETVLQQADAVVSLAGFAAFVPAGAAGRALGVALKGMASCLGTSDEPAMLRKFLSRCASPLPLSALPNNPLLRGMHPSGRQRLRDDLVLLQHCRSLPGGWPEGASVLVVQGEQDAIVCPESRTQLLQALPPSRTDHLLRPDEGHAVVTPAVLDLVVRWAGNP